MQKKTKFCLAFRIRIIRVSVKVKVQITERGRSAGGAKGVRERARDERATCRAMREGGRGEER